ncbi:hypothetical protein FI667_g6253, partial [Globisporangium splendens]
MARNSNAASLSAHVQLPRDSVYELQKSLQGVELLAYLPPVDGVSDKKLSKFVETAFHPLRPWVTAIEPKGDGVIWNYETKEIMAEFSLESSLDAENAAMGDDNVVAPPPPTNTSKTSGLLPKSSSPTATAYMKSNRSKHGSLKMCFYDHEAIVCATQNSAERTCFEEWIVVLTATHVVMCDVNQNSASRMIAADELQRQAPCSLEILPSGLLAIGCQDGKIRVWNPRLWRIVETIDMGSAKDVQQLLFLPSQLLNANRNGSGMSATDSAIRGNYVAQHLVGMALDGKVVTWRISVVNSGANFECKKVSEIDLKEVFKQFDSSNGFNELKLHTHQEIMSAATKDGTVFFFDLSSLFRQAKGPNLLGVLPSTKLPSPVVVPGPRKGAFLVLSIPPSSNSVPPNMMKKLKILSLASSPRDSNGLCCLTTFGLLVLRTCCFPNTKPVFISRGIGKAPLIAYPSTAKVALRFYGEETSSKQEDHKLQCGNDAPNETLKTPLLQPCPSNSAYLAAIVPASTHLEILQMDSELRNQKSVSMTSIFSGNALAFAWHPMKLRFAVLVPHKPNSRRMTRAQTSAHIAPRRRGFMFGGSSKNMSDDLSAAELKLRNQTARLMALAVFEVSADGGHVEMVEENCGLDDHLLHIFSGPLLGVVKYEADEEGGSSADGSSSKSLTDSHDSPSSMMRSKRTESSVFAAISTPTFASSGSGGSFSEPQQIAEASTSGLKKAYLEFYEWDTIDKNSGAQAGKLEKIGAPLDCPLALEWERCTNRFCALIYPNCVKVYRATASPPDLVCLHEIPTFQTAQSVKWVNHTLFFATEDEIKCCVVSKTRCLSLCLHPQLPLLIAHWHSFHSNSSIIAWEFQPSIGGGSGAGVAGVTSDWLDLIPGSLKMKDDACTAGVYWYRRELIAYKPTHARSLSALSIGGGDSSATSTPHDSVDVPSLPSSMQLNLEHVSSIGSSEYILQHFALQSGASEKLDDLPVWKNYQGKSLVPWKAVANHNQSVVCVQLKDPVKAQYSQFSSSGNGGAEDRSFSYVVMEIKPKAGGNSSRRVDTDGGDDGGSASNFRVACGSQLDALDVCFVVFNRPDNETQGQRPWLLVVLASTGKSLCLQTQCDQVDESARIVLRREIERIFLTPIPLTPQSPYVSTIGVRLLYLSMGNDSRQLVQLSEDDLNVPNPASTFCT